MDFVKMQGLGNDFVLVVGPRDVSKDEIVAWCNRRTGVGADGVLVATPIDERRVRMEYWNADGSPAEMCGNGLRCVARFARDESWVGASEFSVETASGERAVTVLDDGSVRAFVGVPGVADEPVELAGYEFVRLSVGNPHAVAFVEDPFATPVEAIGPIVEGDPAFPDRTNVEFVSIVDRRRLLARIWERGVGETLASGTGAVAAAFAAHGLGKVESVVTVELLGGPLGIEINTGGAWMEGPAEYSFRGTLG